MAISTGVLNQNGVLYLVCVKGGLLHYGNINGLEHFQALKLL